MTIISFFQVIDWELRKCRPSIEKIYLPTFYEDLDTKVSPQSQVNVHYYRAKLNCPLIGHQDRFEPWSFRDLPDCLKTP